MIDPKKVLTDWDYKNYRYQIINPQNIKIKKFLYLFQSFFSDSTLEDMQKQYVLKGFFNSILGNNEYSQSFITSEWLFHSLDGKRNFDYTSVISGYLKSIEQLLFKIVMLNIENNCKISMSKATDVVRKVKNSNIRTYKRDGSYWKEIGLSDHNYIYIDLTQEQKQYMDSSIGAFEYFLRFNQHIFIDPSTSETIADMVSCFRAECRNGYFHTHNLNDWTVVKKIRDNAIYLYFVLLGGIRVPLEKQNELGIMSNDRFDELCKRIREFHNYNGSIIFSV